MDQLTIHPGWADGRKGYLWCRLEEYVQVEQVT
jgi:hypothetical protein